MRQIQKSQLIFNIRASFGFPINPELSVKKNVQIITGNMPADLYFTHAHNIAFHNLCSASKFPTSIKSLLGLSLKFIPNKNSTRGTLDIDIPRFKQDSKHSMYFADNTEPYKRPPFWVPSCWMPPEPDLPVQFRNRISNFVTNINVLFKKKRNKTNLMFFQQHAFRFLRQSKDFVILKTDKNLSPAILEKDCYVQRALPDHLLSSTYRQLTCVQAQGRLKAIE